MTPVLTKPYSPAILWASDSSSKTRPACRPTARAMTSASPSSGHVSAGAKEAYPQATQPLSSQVHREDGPRGIKGTKGCGDLLYHPFCFSSSLSSLRAIPDFRKCSLVEITPRRMENPAHVATGEHLAINRHAPPFGPCVAIHGFPNCRIAGRLRRSALALRLEALLTSVRFSSNARGMP